MTEKIRLPRENLVRMIYPGPTFRDASEGDGPHLTGHFAVFNQWTEIDSWIEGHFMERLAPGCFAKTFQERGDRIKILLQHGRDPQLGQKPIAAPDVVREDEVGAFYDARLLDGLPPLVISGLREGQYGASFTFNVMRDELVQEPKPSAYNPKGLPERTLKECEVPEFGPVTFPQYESATAGIRSITDDLLLERLLENPHAVELLVARANPVLVRAGLIKPHNSEIQPAPSTPGAATESHPGKERRVPVAASVEPRFKNRQEWLKWLSNS